MIGVSERDLRVAASGQPDKCYMLWKAAWHRAAKLGCFTGKEKPFKSVDGGNLNAGDTLRWINSVEAPDRKQTPATFKINQNHVELLARFVKSTEFKVTDKDKAMVA